MHYLRKKAHSFSTRGVRILLESVTRGLPSTLAQNVALKPSSPALSKIFFRWQRAKPDPAMFSAVYMVQTPLEMRGCKEGKLVCIVDV